MCHFTSWPFSAGGCWGEELILRFFLFPSSSLVWIGEPGLNIRWFKTSDWTIPLLSHQGLEITPTQHRYKLWSGKQTSAAQKAAAVWMPNISALRAGGQNQCSIVCTGTTRQVVQPGTPKGDLQYLILLIIYSVISHRGKKYMFTTQDVKMAANSNGGHRRLSNTLRFLQFKYRYNVWLHFTSCFSSMVLLSSRADC